MFSVFKNIRRGGIYSVINIGGLAISLAAVILIMLWVWDELSYERGYRRADDICVAIGNFESDGADLYWDYTPTAISHVAREEIPGVETACAVNMQYDLGFVEYEGRKFMGDDFIMADTTFFRVFGTVFIEGSADDPLPDPYSVVITEEMARRLFGEEQSALGRQIIGGNGGEQGRETYHVTGVVRNPPQNTALQYSAVFSFARSKHRNTWYLWAFKNYILLKPGADKDRVAQQLCNLHNQHLPDSPAKSFRLQPIPDMRLHAPDGSETGMAPVRLFSLIALALLLIACINYINLVTARAAKRSREIAVRKIMGASKGRLFAQLTGEAAALFAIAMVVSIVLVLLLIPFYSQLTAKALVLPLAHPALWMICGISLLSVMLFAGVYPAVKLAMFKPLAAFAGKGAERRARGIPLRKALVVCQFMATVILIAGAIVLSRQMSYIRQKDLGYSREQVMTTNMFSNLNMRNGYRSFKTDLEQHPAIAGVTGSSHDIMDIGTTGGITWEGMQDGRDFSISMLGIDRNFFDVMGIRMAAAAGAAFAYTPADSARYFLNETAIRQMGLDDPVGKWIDLPQQGRGVVAGVVRDFHFRHMNEPIRPIVMYLQETPWNIYVKATGGKIPEAIAAAETAWKRYDADFPFSYRFMDDAFDEMYRADRMQERLFHIFAAIAVIVSCLGLFGLVTYTAASRTKEIGIRKVLGASATSIVVMLSREFLVLAGIAMLVAFPLAWWWLDAMLRHYAYRISIHWWMFALAGIITILLTLLTVGWKSVKAALANPVKAIKSEG